VGYRAFADAWMALHPVLRPRSGYQPGRGFFVQRSPFNLTQCGPFCGENGTWVGHELSGVDSAAEVAS
jgi:hypothetical protein